MGQMVWILCPCEPPLVELQPVGAGEPPEEGGGEGARGLGCSVGVLEGGAGQPGGSQHRRHLASLTPPWCGSPPCGSPDGLWR